MAEHTKVLELLPEGELRAFLEESCEQVFLDIESEGRLNDREAIALIKKTCKLKAVTDFVALPRELQVEYLCELHAVRCSIRQLVRLVGVSKAQIERMLK